MKTEQIERLFKECPKAIKEVQKYLLRSIEELPELPEFAKIKEDFDNKGLSMVKFYMNMGPRFLYEFFDGKGIYIDIYSSDELETVSWVSNLSIILRSSRVLAEEAAFEEAFKILEGRL